MPEEFPEPKSFICRIVKGVIANNPGISSGGIAAKLPVLPQRQVKLALAVLLRVTREIRRDKKRSAYWIKR